MKQNLPDVFATPPIVYLIGHEYQIMVPVSSETLMWVRVGENEYFDDSNGALRSASLTHKMSVPMEELDAAKKYTICFRRVFERLPYFSKTGEVEEVSFDFKPVASDASEIRIYHVADTHNRKTGPVAAGSYFGEDLDLLVLNGDVPEDSGRIENFTTIHRIAGDITQGRVPVVFARGNHDCRGIYAEKLAEHIPTLNGNTYYTFKAGPLWGLVLDCGEDKVDSHPEYGNTVCCHSFRLRETRFIQNVIRHASDEYADPEVKYRMVIAHCPFHERNKDEQFAIEEEIYREWCRLLREYIHPQVMLFGHIHQLYVTRPGEERDAYGLPCPAVVASKPQRDESQFAGAAMIFAPEGINVLFTDQDKNILRKDFIPL